MENKYFNTLDTYEVEKEYYSSYEYRCKNRQLMKRTPREGLTIWEDLETGKLLYGKEVTDVMAMEATRYFIFEILEEKMLGPEKAAKYVHITEDEYKQILELLASKKK